jgi:hypothetical protein
MTLTKDTLAVLRRSYLRKPIVKEAAKSERSRAVAFMVSGIPLGKLFALTTTGFIIEKWGMGICFLSLWRLGFGLCVGVV